MLTPEAAYLNCLASGDLSQRVDQAYQLLTRCCLCAWECGVNRRAGKVGVCKTGERARVSSYGPHSGEEDPLRGWRGSGTIFFSSCNMHCQFCQNHEISQSALGYEVEPEGLAAIMLELQSSGSHNINLVSPSHVVPQILAAVLIAAKAGLRLPLVYNTGGYDSIEALNLLEGVIDIYMPDMKYASSQVARHYSKIPHYAEINRAAVCEMHRQVGDLMIDERGLATRGLLVRHLVLPNGVAGSVEIFQFLASEISPNTYINIMTQYRPAFNASQFPKISRRPNQREFHAAYEAAREAGLHRLEER